MLRYGFDNCHGVEPKLDMKLQHRASTPGSFFSAFTGIYKSGDQFGKFGGGDPNHFSVPERHFRHPSMALFSLIVALDIQENFDVDTAPGFL